MGTKIIVPAVMLAFLCSCQDSMQPDVPDAWAPGTISVKVDFERPCTKVGYTQDDGTLQMFWHRGDRIQFANLSNLANIDACLAAESEGETTSFSGQITTWLGKSDVVAVYPHLSGLFCPDGTAPDPESGPQHMASGECDASRVHVRLPNLVGDNVSVVPGNHVTNGVYVSLGRDAVAESQSNYSIPSLQFHQATSLVKADFAGFQAPLDEVSFNCDYDVFPVEMYVDPSTACANWPDGFDQSSVMRSNLDYSVIRNNGEAGNDMCLPMFPSDLSGKQLEITVAQGDQTKFFEDVQFFKFRKAGRVFERNKIYNLTLRASDALTSTPPQIPDATVNSVGSTVMFSYNVPDGVNWMMAMLATSDAPDGSGIIKLLEPNQLAYSEQNGSLVASGSFDDVPFGSYYLYGYTSDEYFVKWKCQNFYHFNSQVAAPSVSLLWVRDVANKIRAVGYCTSNNTIEKGFCYNTTGEPTINDSKVVNNSTVIGEMISTFSVSAGHTYYVRAYAINEGGVGYSDVKSINM